MLTTFSKSSSKKLLIAFSPVSNTPALLTNTSILPNLLTAASIKFSQSSTFETSVGTAKTWPPNSSISFATLSNASFANAAHCEENYGVSVASDLEDPDNANPSTLP